MALLDKLGELAKNVGDKTNELIETGRLSSRAKSEDNAIDELKKAGPIHLSEVFGRPAV